MSGGATVIGDMVFVSNLAKQTQAYGARTGQKLGETDKGAFNPAIADEQRIYLVGYSSLFSVSRDQRTRPLSASSAYSLRS